MRAKHWWMFMGWQLAGSLAAMTAHTAHPIDRLSWKIYVVMLVPGSFASTYFFRDGMPDNYWPKWAPYAMVTGINIALFLAADLAKRTLSKTAR